MRVLLPVPRRLIINIPLLQRISLAFSLHTLCSSIVKFVSVAPHLKAANLQLLIELNPSKTRIKQRVVITRLTDSRQSREQRWSSGDVESIKAIYQREGGYDLARRRLAAVQTTQP